jgi:ribosomal protein S18 acetylase RimI-like enzyme
VQYEPLSLKHTSSLANVLKEIESLGERRYFHPHEFDKQSLEKIATDAVMGGDEYWVGVVKDDVASYGMLRGWRDGYVIPSLGIAIAPGYRRLGYAKHLMAFLHGRASARGALSVRLKVNRQNSPAIQMYKELGYVLTEHSPEDYVGLLSLR